jgi:glycosyltransferase involved in cell wall biosynthesis
MELAVVLDHRFFATPDGAVWTKTAYAEEFWRRYLRVFEHVTIVARAESVASPAPGWQRVDSDHVSFTPVPYYLGPWQYLLRLGAIRRTVRGAVSGDSAVILRSGELANCAASALLASGKPLGAEVCGDPYDSLAPGCVRSVVRPLARAYAARALKKLCRSASAVSYVTEGYLQRRYPAGGREYAISDVELSAGEGAHHSFVTHYSSIQLDREAFADSSTPLRRTEPVRHAVFIGSLAQTYKGLDVLLEAFSTCVRGGLDLRLSVAGDGKHRQELERQAGRLGLSGRISFLGELPAGTPVRELLDGADLFVLPSRTEGLPRAMIEAMARGLPCIGTAVGGVPELLDSDDLAAPGDAASLCKLIRGVCADPDRRARMAARNLRKATEFRTEALTQRRDEFYGNVRRETEGWLAGRRLVKSAAVEA